MKSGYSSTCRILHLIPYPPHGPTHGGKIRAREISQVLSRIDPHIEVMHVGDSEYKERDSQIDLMAIPRALVGDLEMFQRDFQLSRYEFPNLQVIVFEHPWLWNEVKSIKSRYPKVKVVYSSHNVEYQLKDEILFKYLGMRASAITDAIRAIEIDISKSVDRVLVVSQNDKDWYSRFAKLEPILAPNGARQRISVLNTSKRKSEARALVVGSAHPPNIEGCLKFLSDPDLWMPPNSKIVVAGSLADALSGHWGHLRNRWGEFCIELFPQVSDLELAKLLEECNVILLPIAYGGGTNLKTAEALVAGRPIVASIESFRGYEDYIKSPLVKIAETNLDFKALTTSRLMRTRIASVDRDTSKLHWDATLDSIETAILELVND
jgi:hypothetical protein